MPMRRRSPMSRTPSVFRPSWRPATWTSRSQRRPDRDGAVSENKHRNIPAQVRAQRLERLKPHGLACQIWTSASSNGSSPSVQGWTERPQRAGVQRTRPMARLQNHRSTDRPAAQPVPLGTCGPENGSWPMRLEAVWQNTALLAGPSGPSLSIVRHRPSTRAASFPT